MPIDKPYIHPNTPPKLRTAFRSAKNLRGEGYKYHVLAKNLKVNVGHLHRLIKQGIEPPDTTEKGRAVRAAMFLPRMKRVHHEKKTSQPMPHHLYWWKNVLTKEIRNHIIRQAWINLNGSKSWTIDQKTSKSESPRSPANQKASRTR